MSIEYNSETKQFAEITLLQIKQAETNKTLGQINFNLGKMTTAKLGVPVKIDQPMQTQRNKAALDDCRIAFNFCVYQRKTQVTHSQSFDSDIDLMNEISIQDLESNKTLDLVRSQRLVNKIGAIEPGLGNQMLRAAYPAMQNIARTILKNKRAYEAEKYITPISEVIGLIK